MLWICCPPHASRFGTLSCGHTTGNSRFSFQCKNRQSKEFENYWLIAHISHSRKEMIKIPQARLQQNANKLLTPFGSSKKNKRTLGKHLLLFAYAKDFDWHNKITQQKNDMKTWNILQNTGIHASREIVHPCKYHKYLSTWKIFSVNSKGELW